MDGLLANENKFGRAAPVTPIAWSTRTHQTTSFLIPWFRSTNFDVEKRNSYHYCMIASTSSRLLSLPIGHSGSSTQSNTWCGVYKRAITQI